MGFFDSMKGGGSSDKDQMRPSPVREFLGPELYAVDCRGANLYVHENAVVIDKTGGGLWNLGDNNFKVIPFRSIVAIHPGQIEIHFAQWLHRVRDSQQSVECRQ